MNQGDSSRIPFSIRGAAGVHADRGGKSVVLWIPEVEGLLGVVAGGLILQYRVRDKAAAYDSGVCELRLSFDAVDTLEIRHPWLRSPSAVLRVRDLGGLESLPGARAGEVTLHLRRRDLQAAHDLSSTFALHAAEHALSPAAPPATSRQLDPGETRSRE